MIRKINEKGFISKEFCVVAVIIIVAVFGIMPFVFDIINNTKEKALIDNVKIYKSEINKSITKKKLVGEMVTDGCYYIMNNGNICLNYENNECISGEINVNNDLDSIKSGLVKIENQKVSKVKNVLVQNKYISEENGKYILSDGSDDAYICD